eukprot:1144200-Pelagomonas_calceolata.AAC.7
MLVLLQINAEEVAQGMWKDAQAARRAAPQGAGKINSSAGKDGKLTSAGRDSKPTMSECSRKRRLGWKVSQGSQEN